jgi:nucleoside-diphosphate-sugar epimerase
MSNPILITGAAGGQQGSTGRVIAMLLLDQGLPVRAFVHKIDARSGELRQRGAEIIEGDLNPHALDHLTHLWQYFRESKEHRQATDTVRAVTGRDPQTLEAFFRENSESFDTHKN